MFSSSKHSFACSFPTWLLAAALIALVSACDNSPKPLELPTDSDGSHNEATAKEGGLSLAADRLALAASAELPLAIMDQKAQQVCVGTSFRNREGKVVQGSRLCGPFVSCTKSGQTGCITTANAPAMERAKVTTMKLKVGATLLGVVGSYEESRFLDCTAANQNGCTSTAQLVPISRSILNPSNIKAKVAIAPSLVGAYPSVRYPLTSANPAATPLTAANMNTAIATHQPYEFFDAHGESHTVYGDLHLNSAHIMPGHTVYGVKGEANDAPAKTCSRDGERDCKIDANWLALDPTALNKTDIKKGFVLGGVEGLHPSAASPLAGNSAMPDLNLDQNLSQLASTASFEFFDHQGRRYTQTGSALLKAENIKSGTTVLGVSGSLNGVDLNGLSRYDLRRGIANPNGVGTDRGQLDPHSWCPSKSNCMAHFWRDITKLAQSTKESCDKTADTCVFRNLVQQVDWAFPLTKEPTNWLGAVRYCKNLNLYGKTNWRVASQKVLLQASANSLMRMEIFDTEHFKGNSQPPKFWSTTAITPKPSSGDINRVIFDSASDDFSQAPASDSHNVACVRDLEPDEAFQAKHSR